jgi:transposase
MPWCDLPERYGPCATAYNRCNRCSRRGIGRRIFDTLRAKSRDSLLLIDSTILKVHHAASGAKGAEKSGHRVLTGLVVLSAVEANPPHNFFASARKSDRAFTIDPPAPSCDLPERYGPYTTAHNRFDRWSSLLVKTFNRLPQQNWHERDVARARLATAFPSGSGARAAFFSSAAPAGSEALNDQALAVEKRPAWLPRWPCHNRAPPIQRGQLVRPLGFAQCK